MRQTPVRGPRRLTRALTLALVIAFAAPATVATAPASAGSDPDDRKARIDRQLAKARENLDDLSADAKAAYLALRATQLAIPQAKAVLVAARARVKAAEARKLQLDAELAIAKQELEANQATLNANAQQIDQAENRRDELARKAYEGGGLESFAQLALLMGPGTAQDLTDRLYFVEKASSRQHAVLDELDAARRAALAEQERLETTRRRVAQLNLQAKAALAEADEAKHAARLAEAQVVHLAAVQNRQNAALNRRVNAEKRRVDELQAASDRLAAILAARARARRAAKHGRVNRPPQGSGVLAIPVEAPISSEFGMRYHPILHYSRLHAGMDFAAACGAPVYAAGSGEVIEAGWAGGYGNAVVIAHGDSLATTYNHLERIAVRGGSVSRGDLIGYAGTTGLSTGCHLHFEVRVDGVPVNPRDYL